MSEYLLIPRLNEVTAGRLRNDMVVNSTGGGEFDSNLFESELSESDAFPATGGRPATEGELLSIRESCLNAAARAADTADDGKAAALFDLFVGEVLFDVGRSIRGEMGNPKVWDFITLVLMPDLAARRIAMGNVEDVPRKPSTASTKKRLTGGDRRHVLQRLWRRWQVFGKELVEGRRLTEDDYVAMLERRLTLEQGAVARRAAKTIISSGYSGSARREYTRILMRNLVQLSGIVHVGEDDLEHLDHVFAYLHEQTTSVL